MTDSTLSLWKEPSAELKGAEEELATIRLRLDKTVRALLVDWESANRERIWERFSQVLEQVESAYGQRLAGFEAALGSDPDPRQVWEEAALFVEGVRKECVVPLVRYVGEHHPLEELEQTRQDLEHRLSEEIGRLPAHIRLPRPTDLLDPADEDGLLRRLGKSARRIRRRVRSGLGTSGNAVRRLVGRPVVQLPHPSRTVPLARLAQERVAGDVFRLVDREQDRSRRQIGTLLKSLERQVWEWTVQALNYLSELDAPEHHVPRSIRLKAVVTSKGTKALPEGPLPASLPAFSSGFVAVAEGATQPPSSHLNVSQIMERFREDLSVAGTFLYQAPALYHPPAPYWPRPAASPPAGVRTVPVSRPDHTLDRLLLCDALLDLRTRVIQLEDTLLDQIAGQAIAPMEHTYDSVKMRLSDIETEARAIVEAGTGGEELADELEALLQRSASVENLYRDLPGLSAADRALTDPGQTAWRDLMKHVAGLPDDLRLRGLTGESPKSFRADLLEAARGGFERAIPSRIAPTAEPLRRAIARVWNDTEQVREVVSNTFNTAIQHLRQDEDHDRKTLLPAPEQAEDDLEELMAAGLRRAADSLEERYQSLSDEWGALIAQLHKVLISDWNTVFRDVQSEDFLAKRILGIQTLIARRSEQTWTAITDGWDKLSTQGRAAFRLVRIRTRSLIQIGQSAVGVSGTSAEERHRALDTVSSARTLYAALPLVYRRLFSTEPLADPGLAENRAEDLRTVEDLIDRWQRGLGSGIIVVETPLGAGRTTFLRLLDLALKESMRTVRIPLESRPADEQSLASLLAETLYPEESFEGGLDQLEEVVRSREKPKSALVLVDNLELLLFQAPGGTALLHRFLLFAIRTDDQVTWCCSVGSLAWQFAIKAASGATRLAITHRLSPWSTTSMEDLIMRRHRRSGVPIVFEPPTEPSPLIRQRLRRAKTHQVSQRILATEFFESLAKSAGQSPTRALFEWIRAGRFSPDGDQLTIESFKTLSFSYLQLFENDIAFTMRHFMVHNVLTVEELAILSGTSHANAIMALETLLSEGLIEPLDVVDGATIVPRCRYRLRRLVLEPVVNALREKHFVY